MFKAGVLVFTLFISFFIGVVLTSLILYVQFASVEQINYSNWRTTFQNAESGINLLLAKPNEVPLNQASSEKVLFQEDTVILFRKNWGAFEIIHSTAIKKNFSASKTALVGFQSKNLPALFLADENKPLSLCGETRIEGEVFLPQTGVKRAYIEGKNYTGEKLIYGFQKESENKIPALNDTVVKLLQDQLQGNFSEQDSMITVDEIEIPKISHSFTQKTLVIQSTDPILLNGIELEGNIVVHSYAAIHIFPNTQLNNVICFAPYIYVHDDVDTQVQVYARDSIRVGSHVLLEYPSVVGLLNQEPLNDFGGIIIEEGSEIRGALFGQKTVNTSKKIKLEMRENSKVVGLVHVKGILNMKGSVYGNTYCERFILKTPSSVYENHLLDVELNATKLPEEFVSSAIFKKGTHKEVIEWLN